MKVVYVAGPFRAPTHWGIVENVRRAENAALEIWRAGAVALCPHLNTANFQGALPDEAWLDGTVELLGRCDAMLLVGDWKKSKSTKVEIKHALSAGIAIFPSISKLRTWIKATS